MADAVTTKYIWPPNFDGNPPESGVGWKRVRVQLTGVSDGTGESAVKKIDLSDLRGPSGLPVRKTALELLEYDGNGFTSIVLEWDRAPREKMAVLSGNNHAMLDYRKSGGLMEQSNGVGDQTGDVLLTSNGATSGDSYNIILSLLLFE